MSKENAKKTPTKQADAFATFNKQAVIDWIAEGKIDPTIGKTIIDAFDDDAKNGKKSKQADSMRHLRGLKNLLGIDSNDEGYYLFKKNVDHEQAFGVTKALMDRLNYLPDLLDNSYLIYPKAGSSLHIISSNLSEKSDSGVGAIGLEYTLHMQDATPEEAFKNYITEMQTNALMVFLAYWAYANKEGAFHYEADITDIMSLMAGVSRDSFFATKEKRRFWYLSQLLERTYLTITVKHKNKWRKIKHPLLSFVSTESDKEKQEAIDGHPNKVTVRVLDPDKFKETANLATEVSKKTITGLRSEDIMLALSLQIRASQRRDAQELSYDEKYLMERARLQKTQSTNPRVARKRLGEKLDRVKNADGIDSWKKADQGKYSIKTKNRRNTKP